MLQVGVEIKVRPLELKAKAICNSFELEELEEVPREKILASLSLTCLSMSRVRWVGGWERSC